MKTLVFRAPGVLVPHDAQVVDWGANGPLLPPDAQDAVDEAAMAWTKAWGRRPLRDGRSFRELYTWQGVSLWWFVELYLHHSTRSPRYVRLIEACARVLQAERPDEVEVAGLPEDEAVLVGRTATSLGILFHGPRHAAAPRGVAGVVWRSRWNTLKTLATTLKALVARPPRPTSDHRRTLLFLSHAAFWRERRDPDTDMVLEYEHYFDRLIPEAAADPELQPFVLAVGPRTAHRRRSRSEQLSEWIRLHPEAGPYVHINRYTNLGVWRALCRSTREARRVWHELRQSPAIHEAFSHRGVRFFELAEADLAGTLLLQWPWAVRSYEEMAHVLRTVQPAVVCLYAESSGWGRAAIAASRAAGIPTVAVQHGILYPKYYSYRHDADEADSPRPDRTAVFGEAARRILTELGRYPPESLVLTGSPKFDDLVASAAQWDRAGVRARLGVGEQQQLLLVASRYQGIRDTHQSIGSAFEPLLRAVEALPSVRCLVKPHPAEPANAYAAAIAQLGARQTQVLPRSADLMELLHAADALVTVESLSAVEALVLGRPVLVLNTPTNLRELVEAGAALGVPLGQDPLDGVRAVLFDAPLRARLETARVRYLSDVAMGVDGGASARILALLRGVALPEQR